MERKCRATFEAYKAQEDRAKTRDIDWLFTYSSWCDVWEQSGKWDKRGKRSSQYCMGRIGDTGPYSPENVIIITNKENSASAEHGTPNPNCGHKRCKKFYMFEGLRFDKQDELVEFFGYSLRWVQNKVRSGYIETWTTIPEYKWYCTPIGDFTTMKECCAEVRKQYRKDLTRQAIWHRFQNDSWPEFYYKVTPEIEMRVK